MAWSPEKQRAYMKTYYRKNREAMLAQCAEWRGRNREHHLALAREYHHKNRDVILPKKRAYWNGNKELMALRRRAGKYGLAPEKFLAMLDAQNGCCVICLEYLDKPVVDHCHETGKVRALLCSPCNTAIGLLKECPVRMRSAIDYVTQAAMQKANIEAAQAGMQ